MSDKQIILEIVKNIDESKTFEEILYILFKDFIEKKNNEEIDKKIIEKLRIAEKQIENGEGEPAEVVFAELERKYNNKGV